MTDVLTNTSEPVTATYSRAAAIAAGVLHDVTADARGVGILLPTAIAEHAWTAAVAWPHSESALRCETGRTWTVLAHAAQALERADRRGRGGLQLFNVTPAPALDGEDPVTLCVEVGTGDTGELVLTITAAADR